MNLEPSHLLAGGFAVGLVAAFWSKLKGLAARLTSYMVVRFEVEDAASPAVVAYAWRNFKHSPYGRRRYKALNDFVRPNRRYEFVGYETVGDSPLVFWKGWRPFILRLRTSEGGNRSDISSREHGYQLTVTFLRGTFTPDDVVSNALKTYNDTLHHGAANGARRFDVMRQSGSRARTPPRTAQDSFPAVAKSRSLGSENDNRLLQWSKDDLGMPVPEDPLSSIAKTAEMELLVNDVRRWVDSKTWFEEKRIPWRMGALLWGAPGTGKSTLVRALAQTLDLPIYTYDLATFDNAQLTQSWQYMLGSAPCVALLEDIDAVFHGRENVTSGEDGDGVTFDCLLNLISGVGDASGILVVVTTNRIEFLDDALGKPDPERKGVSTRPGRIDRVVEFPALTEAGRRTIAARILADCPDEIDAVVAKCDGYSGAQLEEICTRVALQHYWARKEPETCSKCVDSTSIATERPSPTFAN